MKTLELVLSIVIVFVLGFSGGALYMHLKRGDVPANTVIVEKPAKPDTVIVRDTVITKQIKWRTVYRDKEIVKVVRDTVLIETGQSTRVYKSIKSYRFPYSFATVSSYGKAPADSIGLELSINWGDYYRDHNASKQFGSLRWSGFKWGVVTGSFFTAVAIYALK
jgi:hypothetical protein